VADVDPEDPQPARERRGNLRTITLTLSRVEHLFVLPEADVLSVYRNFLTGIETVLSELRADYRSHAIRLVLRLPTDQVEDGDEQRIESALERYCDFRYSYNRREISATRRDGFTSLWIGLLIATVGLLISTSIARMEDPEIVVQVIGDHFGWVLAWIGLWYPLDTMVFTPRPLVRENRTLRRVRDAEVVIETFEELDPWLPATP
jgi:hypothetical protein